jgi:hypothetical protein
MKILLALLLSACATETAVIPPIAPPTTSPAPGNPEPQTVGTGGIGSSTGTGCLRTKTPRCP